MEENIQKKTSFFKSKGFIAACVAVLVVALLAVGISAALNSAPMTQISKAGKKSARALEKNDVYTTLYDFLDNGSIEMSWELEQLLAQTAGIPLDLDLGVKMYMDAKNQAFAERIAISVYGDDIIDALLYLDPSKLVASCPAFLGEKAYGINLDKIAENFGGSVFAEDGAYSIGVDDDEVVGAIDDYVSQIEYSEEFSEETADIFEKLMAVLMKSLSKNGNITKQAGSIDFAGEAVATNDIVITLNAEAVLAVSKDAVNYLDGNEKIDAYIKKYADRFIYAYGMDAEALYEEYRLYIKDAVEALNSYDDEFPEGELEIIVSISKAKKELVGIKLSVPGDDTVALNAICGPTWDNITEFEVSVTEYGSVARIYYIVTENTKAAYASEFSVAEDGAQLMKVALSWDKESGDFKFTFADDIEELICLEGIFEYSDKKVYLEFDSVTVEGSKIEIGKVTMTALSDDKMPKVGEYTDVLTMDEDSINEIITKFAEFAGGIASLLPIG